MAERKRPPRKGEGRPPHKPTKKTRDDVVSMKAMNWKDTRIMRHLRIGSKTTLYKHYREELDHGGDTFRVELMGVARKSATGGVLRRAKDAAHLPPDGQMQRFLLARVCGLKEEKMEVEHSGEVKVGVGLVILPPVTEDV